MTAIGRRSADLLAVAGLAAISALAALASPPSWLEAVMLLPLALALPGYALAAAFFPPGTIPVAQRFVHSFVLGVSAAGIGLLLQLFVALDRTAWATLLLGLTLAACAVALSRRWAAAPAKRRAPGRPRLPLLAALIAALGLAGAGASVAIAVDGVREQQSRQVFASLWAAPAHEEAAAPVEVGVRNHGGPSDYKLAVSVAGKVVQTLPARLGGRPEWQTVLAPPVTWSTESLLITLMHRGRLYRSLELNVGAR